MEDSEEAMREFMREGGYSFPVMLDGDSVARDYKVRGYPTQILLDSDGNVVRIVAGAVTALQLSRLVDDLTG